MSNILTRRDRQRGSTRTTALAVRKDQALTPNQSAMLELVTAGYANENTQRNYKTALTDFFHWHREAGFPALSRPVIEAYLAQFSKKQKKAKRQTTSSLIQRLAVIRKLVKIGVQDGKFPIELLTAVNEIKVSRQRGTPIGIWLNKDEARLLLNAPDLSTLRGKRDRAILGVMLALGLRRFEVANLDFTHLELVETRWVIKDLVGKKNRVRTVPMPDWLIEAIDLWAQTARIKKGRIFRPIDRNDKLIKRNGVTPQTIRNVVTRYAKDLSKGRGKVIAPHDLRRTFAKIAHKGGASIDQIQLSLGHDSIETTQLYLGLEQDLEIAPCDFVDIA